MAYQNSAACGITMLLWVMVCLLCCCEAMNVPSVEEYLEMKKYLEFINRPGEKEIMDEFGQVFDCVDINKQPALDHPLLKNHTIEFEMISEEAPSYIAMKTGLPGGGCPLGTVPIRRIQMEEVIRAGSVSNFMMGGKVLQGVYHEYATARITGGPYYGMSVGINVWDPKVNQKGGEVFSLSQLWIASGPSSSINTIETGWQDFPGLYNDDQPHLFVFWTADGYKTYCYNLRCPGFVQTSQTITPEMRLSTSVSNGNQVDITLNVFKDSTTGNWRLGYKEGSNTQEFVGYWPGNLFNHLKTNGADRLEAGGEVAGNFGSSYPPMGSGALPSQGYKKASYLKNVQYVDNNYKYVDFPKQVVLHESKKNCYKIEDKGTDPILGRAFYYGGPGGQVC